MPNKAMCLEFGCNYPEAECDGTCQRNAVIASNGNDGLHYQHKGRVQVVLIEDGKVTMDYMSNWLTGDGVEQMERAKAMIDMVLRARGQE